jgi:hypothetical protein
MIELSCIFREGVIDLHSLPVLPIGAEVLPGKITLKGGRLRPSPWRRDQRERP